MLTFASDTGTHSHVVLPSGRSVPRARKRSARRRHTHSSQRTASHHTTHHPLHVATGERPPHPPRITTGVGHPASPRRRVQVDRVGLVDQGEGDTLQGREEGHQGREEGHLEPTGEAASLGAGLQQKQAASATAQAGDATETAPPTAAAKGPSWCSRGSTWKRACRRRGAEATRGGGNKKATHSTRQCSDDQEARTLQACRSSISLHKARAGKTMCGQCAESVWTG